jgi:hypothetical protein
MAMVGLSNTYFVTIIVNNNRRSRHGPKNPARIPTMDSWKIPKITAKQAQKILQFTLVASTMANGPPEPPC